MTDHITAAQLRAMGGLEGLKRSGFKGRGRTASPALGRMNKLETRYYAYLDALQCAGEILDFGYERIKFRLAKNTFYTPDFDVIRADRTMEIHETKGFWEDDARVKIKCAAEIFWFYKFFAVQWKGGQWQTEEVVP